MIKVEARLGDIAINLELERYNAFAGDERKVKVARAIYIASRSAKEPVRHAYARILGKIPVRVKIEDDEMIIEKEARYLKNSPWTGEILLQSTRVGYFLALSKPEEDISSVSPQRLDFEILRTKIKDLKEKSLIVIEEPEIHKRPTTIVDYIEELVELAEKKKLTVIMTTNSDIPLLSLASLVGKKRLNSNDIAIYHFGDEISRIKIYEDGVIDVLPEEDEVIPRLFLIE